MSRSDWPLLALISARGGRLTPIQLQKTLFIFGEQFQSELAKPYYNFEPYHYGPFDAAINRDLEELESAGLLEAVDTSVHRGRDYELTAEGEERAEDLLARLPSKQAAYMKALVRWVQSLTFRELVSAVYRAYPKMAENSAFR